jgi:predicted transcriptional regulator
MYEIYVSKKIEQGIKDADEGKVISNEEAKKRLLKK